MEIVPLLSHEAWWVRSLDFGSLAPEADAEDVEEAQERIAEAGAW